MEDWDIVAGTRTSSRTEPKKGRNGSLVVRSRKHYGREERRKRVALR
jgi:hypothetical protein